MKTTIIVLAMLLSFVFACKDISRSSIQEPGASENLGKSANVNSDNNHTKQKNITPLERKFVRTADLKFGVKDLKNAILKIEQIAQETNGFTVVSQLSSNLIYNQSTQISKDTILESTEYSYVGKISIRVPSRTLESATNHILEMANHIDSRNISAEDVSLLLVKNDLTMDRSLQNDHNLHDLIDAKNGKVHEALSAEEISRLDRENHDEAYLSSLDYTDKIAFSTINIDLYQPNNIVYSKIPTTKSFLAYEPSFSSKLLLSIETGWLLLLEIVLFIAKFWVLLLIGVIWLWYKRKDHPYAYNSLIY